MRTGTEPTQAVSRPPRRKSLFGWFVGMLGVALIALLIYNMSQGGG